jgi:hypothetical protein
MRVHLAFSFSARGLAPLPRRTGAAAEASPFLLTLLRRAAEWIFRGWTS